MPASIRWRFAFTLGANFFRALLSFLTGMLLARWLGPKAYGNMAFLLGTFLAVRQLLDLGSSSAFFTFLSQRARSRRFVGAFFVWLAVQFLVPLLVVGVLFPSRWIEAIWHGEERWLVLLAFAAAFMQYSVWPVVQQAGESQRRTVWVQGIGVAVGSVHLIAVVLLMYSGALGLYAIFVAIAVEYLLAAVVAQQQFSYATAGEAETGEDAGARAMLRKYWNYCFPLILYSLMGFAYEFADRWLLQSYGGSVEQAYYAVGSQFAAIALIATTSILRIFWKEVAEAHDRKDHVRTGELYKKVSRLLYLAGAVIAGFLVPWSEELLRFILGTAYVGGATTMAIMLVYPVHQSMGQIGGTLLLATERVSIQVYTGIGFMILSMAVSYLVLASPDAMIPGLGLASEGLAIKMFAMQLIQVNVVAFIISRIWGWSFDWAFQPISLLGCLGLGWVAHIAAISFSGNALHLVSMMILGCVFYLTALAVFVYAMPFLAGVTRTELVEEVGRVFNYLKGFSCRGSVKS